MTTSRVLPSRAGAGVTRVAPPAGSAVAGLYAGAGLLDAYAVALANDAPDDIDLLARATLDRPPVWFTGLLGLRDVLVSVAGIKTSRSIRREAEQHGRETVAFFPVLARTVDELVLGEDDRHLDFRASVLLRRTGPDGGRELVMTTTVHCHNLVGRAYLLAITPFHRLIVQSTLARLAKQGWRR